MLTVLCNIGTSGELQQNIKKKERESEGIQQGAMGDN